jgi:hypothetical protein
LLSGRERQLTIPEVDEHLVEAQYEEMSDPYWQDFPLAGNGSFAAEATLADEIFTSQVRQSVLEERLIDAVADLDPWFDKDFASLVFDYYDQSITFEDIPNGWQPNERVKTFLFQFAGFSRIWVTYRSGENRQTWAK